MKSSVLRDKSFEFSLMVVELCRHLRAIKTEYILCNQLLRSGTAIGALVREAEFAQSKADFINKLSIALKEANETSYWIDILLQSNCIDETMQTNVRFLLTEIIKMLVASINTAKGNKK